MKDRTSSRDGTTITRMPSDLSEEEIRLAFLRARQAGRAGQTIDYVDLGLGGSGQSPPQPGEPGHTRIEPSPPEEGYTGIPKRRGQQSNTPEEQPSNAESGGQDQSLESRFDNAQSASRDGTLEADFDRAATAEQPRTTLKAIADQAIRGMGDEAAAAGLGGMIGSVVPGVGTIAGAGAGLTAKVATDAAMPLLNLGARFLERFGTEEDPIEVNRFPSSNELWGTLMDNIGLERADTPVEEAFAAGFASGGDAVSMALGVAPQVAKNALVAPGMRAPNPTTTQRVGQVMSTGPAGQTVGGIAEGAAGQAGAQVVEDRGGSQAAQEWTRLGSGFLGDLLLSGTIGSMLDNRTAARMLNPAEAPEFSLVNDVNEVYNPAVAFDDEGNPIMRQSIDPRRNRPEGPRRNQPAGTGPMEATRDEVVSASRPTQMESSRASRNETRRGGTGDLIRDRDAQSERVIATLADGYMVDNVDLEVDNVTPRLRELGKEWVEQRNTQYRTALGERAEALNQMSDLGVVDTPQTSQAITEQMERIVAQDAEEFRELSRLLQNWQNELDAGKDMGRLADQLKIIRGHAHPEGLTSGSAGFQKSVVKRIESALQDDIEVFAQNNADPEVYGQYRAAQDTLSDLAQDYQVETLSNLLKGAERGDNVDYSSIGALIRPNTSTADFTTMVKRLDDRGRELLQDAMMGDMLRLADPRSPRTDAFVNQLDLRDPLIAAAFDEGDVDHIRTVRRALEAVGVPAQQFNRPDTRMSLGTNPATGPVMAQASGRMGALAIVLASIAEGATGKLVRNAQTPEARNLAIRLRNIPQGAAGEERAARRLIRAIAGMDPDAALGADRESAANERSSLIERLDSGAAPTPMPVEPREGIPRRGADMPRDWGTGGIPRRGGQ